MAQKTQTFAARRDKSLKHAAPHGAGGFKPLAMPAVAAAVTAGMKARTREAERRDLPAVRQDGFVD